jgi:2-polyprenyl-6-methoxyphenol hydroxylase-like FAD-dependent oxidoreductase
MSARHRVAIVGAGPVGLLLACLLAGRGVDVTVLERREEPSGRTRAVGIHPPGLDALAAAGVADAVRAEAVPIRAGIALCRGRRVGALGFPRPVLALTQDRTESLLEERLAALAPSALRRGADVVSTRPGAVRLAGGEVEAGVLVGADGIRSIVRRDAGIGWHERGTGLRPSLGARGAPARAGPIRGDATPRAGVPFVMADTSEEAGHPDAALLHLEPGGVVESFPLPGGRRRWVVRLDHDFAETSAGREVFAALVRERTGIRLDAEALDEPSPFVARQHLAERFSRDGVALLGDAAHEISPIGGQGMNLGWLDAVSLAEAIGQGTSLEAWGASRRGAAVRAVRRARFNMAMGAPRHGAVLAVRNLSVRALSSAALRPILASAFTMRGL